MVYVVGLGLQNPELKIFFSIGYSVAEILNVKVREINKFIYNFLFIYSSSPLTMNFCFLFHTYITSRHIGNWI